jgi:hypothetical protein
MSEHTKPSSAYLAIPCGAGTGIDPGTVQSLIGVMSSERIVHVDTRQSSALTFNFNEQFVTALNNKDKYGIEYFVMLHADIVPLNATWLDDLIHILEEHHLDVLSAVSPIKNANGLTSTAWDTNPWRPRRISMQEIFLLPETFTEVEPARMLGLPRGKKLLTNTGLMVLKLSSDSPSRYEPWWANFPGFTIRNRIVRAEGKWHAQFEPEDWNFSRWCNCKRLKIGATRAVKLHHCGNVAFNNTQPWGAMATDQINTPDAVAKSGV